MEALAYLFLFATIVFALRVYRQRIRREALMQKYGDSVIVQRIMKQQFWQGQTVEQLIDSLGAPHAVDEKVMKSKIRKTFKYNRMGRNRFGLRVVLENDLVTEWTSRNA